MWQRLALTKIPVCLLFPIGLLRVLPGLAWGGEGQGGEEVHELAPLTVTPTRMEQLPETVPYSIGVVGREEIQRANRQLTLAESLRGVPGVYIQNPWNFAQDTRIAIRGFGARADFGIRGIQLLVDGIPATTPDGQGEVDGIDLGSAGRIEVLRGASAAFFGAASGGVILMETEEPPAKPFVEVRGTMGEDAFRHWQWKAGGRVEDIGYLLSAGYLNAAGYRDHSETENRRLSGKVNWDLSPEKRIRLVWNVIDYPLQNDPGGLTRGEAANDPRRARSRNLLFDGGERVEQQRLGLLYKEQRENGRRLDFAIHSTWRDFANKLPFFDGGQVSYNRHFYGGRFQYGFAGEGGTLHLGADVDVQEDNRRNYNNEEGRRGNLALDQKETVRSAGVFVLGRYRVAENWRLTAALRFDEVTFEVEDRFDADGDDSGDRAFREWSPSIGLSWRVARNFVFYTNASTAFETPTTTEFDNPAGGGFNPNLEAQQSRSFELGLRGSRGGEAVGVSWQAAAFRIEIDDALVPFELPAFPGREFFRNAGESIRNGLELAAEARLPHGFLVAADYTWSDFHYKRFAGPEGDFAGNRIPGIPRHYGSLLVRYDHPIGWFARWRTRLIGSLQANDANSEKVEGYSVTDLRFGYTGKAGRWEWEPFLGIDNLFGEEFFANIRINAFGGRHFEPAPDRRLFGGLRVRARF